MVREVVLAVLSLVTLAHSFSDVGKWNLPLSGETCSFSIAKSLFKGTKVVVFLQCDVRESTNITVSYEWGPSRCSPDYLHYFQEEELVECVKVGRTKRTAIEGNLTTPDPTQVIQELQAHTCDSRNPILFYDEKKYPPKSEEMLNTLRQSKIPPLATVEREGVYMLRMAVQSDKQFNLSINVEMVAPSGYLSAAIWPLLPFFGSMCGVYTTLCSCWLALCAARWRDLLRIQYWIGAVALLGMLESASFYAAYSAINRTGLFNPQAYIFAEWVSVAKRALARMLVIIVSLGFGIVKPRLGPALQRVVGIGALWGALAAINAWLRLHHLARESNRDLLLSEVPLSLLDSAVCWWVFVSLAHTMRTLQLRRNIIKLSLYRHFTNTLVFAVISSVVFMLYSIRSYRMLPCITEWKEVWMDEAYWHVLFVSILTVIMILWRPTNNNQRYAFTPLLDNAEDDEDEEEQFVNDAYGVKMRGPHVTGGDQDRDSQPDRNNSLDSDLRWVEENIPTSTLPLLDSDEEIINTKFEVSKMQ